MKLAAFLIFLAVIFGVVYRLIVRIEPNREGKTRSGFTRGGSLGPYLNGPAIGSPEAEAYSKRLLDERRHKTT